MLKNLNKIVLITLAMTLCVIVLGSYTRLKDAGLGCPDWPGCYGKIFAPSITEGFSQSASTKAWIEMIHRYVAGTLGLLIVYIAVLGVHLRSKHPKLWIITTSALLLVIYQALLGMWTVTLTLNPVIVMGHLLGGFTILSVLWWIYLQLNRSKFELRANISHKNSLLFFSGICAFALVTQIALGGWTSANYSALVCTDFPTCQGNIWPAMDWQNAFALPDLPLENSARVAIQMAHRIGACIVTMLLIVLSFILFKTKRKLLSRLGLVIASLLGLQLCLGITNVLAGLPIIISLGHSAVAALLLLNLIAVIFILHVTPKHC